MKRLIRGPRVFAFSLLAVLAVAGVAVCYPGGLVAAYEDLRDAKELNDHLAAGQKQKQRQAADSARLRDRMEYKEELIAALLRGEDSLAEVSERFADLHRGDSRFHDMQRVQFGARSEEELAACAVLSYVAVRTSAADGSSGVRSRLWAEFEQRFGHPVPKVG